MCFGHLIKSVLGFFIKLKRTEMDYFTVNVGHFLMWSSILFFDIQRNCRIAFC